MKRVRLVKPDGRVLILYGDDDLPDDLAAPSPPGPPVRAATELRWHPFRAEWVDYASHRQERTFLPPSGWDPLDVTRPGREPTELPAGPWSIAVFENRFPSLAPDVPPPPCGIVDSRPGIGVCEVVVYGQSPSDGLGDLPVAHIERLIEVWAERSVELGARAEIAYVMPFENRGMEVGATLHHPHGQIYAYPFVPPVPARELEQQRLHLERHGRGLLEDHIAAELTEGRRVIHQSETAIAFVPAFARYPYEVWIAPRRPVPSLAALRDGERTDLACALKSVVQRYDGLRGTAFPYVMVIHQAPTDGGEHPEAHVHFEFYPPYRTADRLKYLAGTELGAGMFVNDALPESKAQELRSIPVVLEDARAGDRPAPHVARSAP